MEYTQINNTPKPGESTKMGVFKSVSAYLPPLMMTVLCFLMAQALILGSDTGMAVAVLLTIGYCLVVKAENILYMLCGVAMFENVFKIGGDIFWFVLLLILMCKLLARGGGKIRSGAVIPFLVIFSLELILDFSNGSVGQLLVNLVTVTFIFVVFSKIDLLKMNAFRLVFSLFVAFAAVVYYLLSMYGGMGEFLSSFLSSSYAYRFGHSYGETVGGAMAIPLYTTMLISCGLTCYLKSERLRFSQKFLIFLAVAFSAVFGAMTISRSFYVGLIITLLSVALFKASGNKGGKRMILCLIAVVLVLLIFTESDIIDKIFQNLQLRLDSGMEKGSAGRLDIWRSCFEYLLEHPLKLLFGMGATNYVLVGSETGELFSAGAHNLLIDILMSWGFFGVTVLLAFLIGVYKRQKNQNDNFHLQSLIPLITYAFFAMTALRSCTLRTWLFLLIAYVFMDSTIYRKEEKNI